LWTKKEQIVGFLGNFCGFSAQAAHPGEDYFKNGLREKNASAIIHLYMQIGLCADPHGKNSAKIQRRILKYEIRYCSFSGTFYISIILQKPQYIFIDTLF
jgi:hypothetical protein